MLRVGNKICGMINEKIITYKDLIVWQRAMQLVKAIYELTHQFPKSEMYGLTSQMRRASVSIPSNIAEGRRFGSKKEFHRFLTIAAGSGVELETQIEIVKMLPFGQKLNYSLVESLLSEVLRMLNRMTQNLKLTPNS